MVLESTQPQDLESEKKTKKFQKSVDNDKSRWYYIQAVARQPREFNKSAINFKKLKFMG